MPLYINSILFRNKGGYKDMVTLNLTKGQVESLLEFIEFEFIPSIHRDSDCDNMDYLVNICDIYKELKRSVCVTE